MHSYYTSSNQLLLFSIWRQWKSYVFISISVFSVFSFSQSICGYYWIGTLWAPNTHIAKQIVITEFQHFCRCCVPFFRFCSMSMHDTFLIGAPSRHVCDRCYIERKLNLYACIVLLKMNYLLHYSFRWGSFRFCLFSFVVFILYFLFLFFFFHFFRFRFRLQFRMRFDQLKQDELNQTQFIEQKFFHQKNWNEKERKCNTLIAK